MVIKILPLALISLLPITLAACSVDMSSDYGVVAVKVANNREVYFKREVRGLSYDTLVISTNRSPCVMPNAESDYIYPVIGPLELYYKTEGDSLILYGRFKADPPKNDTFTVKIVQNEIDPSEFFAIKSKTDELGLKPLKVEIDKNIKCN